MAECCLHIPNLSYVLLHRHMCCYVVMGGRAYVLVLRTLTCFWLCQLCCGDRGVCSLVVVWPEVGQVLAVLSVCDRLQMYTCCAVSPTLHHDCTHGAAGSLGYRPVLSGSQLDQAANTHPCTHHLSHAHEPGPMLSPTHFCTTHTGGTELDPAEVKWPCVQHTSCGRIQQALYRSASRQRAT